MRRRIGDILWAALLAALLGLSTRPPAPAQIADAGNLAAGLEQPLFLSDRQDDDKDYSLTTLRLVSKVVLLIKQNYVDQSRVKPREMLVSAMNGVEREVAEVLAEESLDQSQMVVHVGSESQVYTISDVESLWEMTFKLRDIFRFIDKNMEEDAERRDIEYAAINGLLSTLDPHSVLLRPQFYEEMKMSTRGEFGGLGIVIAIRDGKLTVVSPIEGTPAYMAGVRAKDQIARIGEESTINMGLEEAVKKLRGPPGTQVTIWIKREQWSEARKYVITRARIKIESVTSELLSQDVGYVRIKNFQSNTASDLQQHMGKMTARTEGGLRGLILDLRDNPGGLLEQAIEVSDKFLEAGVVVSTVGAGKPKVESAHWAGSETDLPIAVLVNAGSASASEIVAGAIKNNDRGVVIGDQTFGKGSVQVLYDFENSSALKLTVAQYLTPGDVSIQNVGITPDIQVQELTASKDYVDLFRDSSGLREENLDKHLEDERIKQQKPVYQVRYLDEEEKETPDEAAERDASLKFRNDFEIEFARKLLVKKPAKTRREILQAASVLVTDVTAQQEQRIVDALGQLGVDWTLGADVAGGRAEAKILSKIEGQAGDKFPIEIEVSNLGEQPLYRVRATSHSENRTFSDHEFIFGTLKPGESRRWTVPIKTSKDVLTRADRVEFRFQEQYGRAPKDLTVTTKLQGLPKPRFDIAIAIDDSKGNGDGLLQVGESVAMVVAVHNVGDGPGIPLTMIKNYSKSAIFITQGRDRLESLEPGQVGVGRMDFDVRAAPKSGIELLVNAMDRDLGGSTVTAKKVILPVLAEGERKSPAKGFATSTSETILLLAASPGSHSIGQLKPGSAAQVVGRVGNYYRLKLEKEIPAFVAVNDVRLLRTKRRPKRMKPPVTKFEHQPPVVTISQNASGLLTDKASITVTGFIDSKVPLRDYFVFANSAKVHYTSNAANSAAKLPFSAVVPLEEGPNYISVVGRIDEELNGRSSIVIFRTKSGVGVAQPSQGHKK